MHYFKRNIGDYAKKAGRLSMLQHGAYTLLLDACYDREEFPTLDEAIEWTWASSKEEVEAVTFVLRKFFTLEDGVYVQKRVQEEIAEYHGKSETNKRIAIEREAKRKEKSTNRAPVVHEAPPNHKPRTINQEPVTSNQEPRTKNQEQNQEQPLVEQNQLDLVADPVPVACPIHEIFAYWQKVMRSPKSVLDDKRKKLIANALKDYSPADICKAIRGCSKTPHNMGQNDRNETYNGLNVILRDADHIDRFIRNDAGNARPASESVEERNARALAAFLGEGDADDQNTIEMEAP